MNTTTQIAYQFVAINNASPVLDQIANSLQKISDLQKNTETLQIGAEKTKQITQNTDKMNKSLGKSIVSMKALKKSINFVTDALEESSSWTENLHMFEVSFGAASDEAYDFAKTIVNAFGTSQNEIIKYAGYFNQIASAIGLADETTNKFSMALTALGYDIASLYNLTIEQAMEKLQAGVVGQTKPLRTLGMDITANTLDAYLKEVMGVSDTTSKMLNQADKMLLRTVVIMQQAQSTYGDMAATINTFANQVKVLQGSISNFKLAIGDLAKEFLAPVVSALAGIMIALTSIIRAFVPEDSTSGIDKITDSVLNLNEELDKTLQKSGLLSFDRFSVLSKGKSNESTSGISELLESEFYEKYEEYMQKFSTSMESIENKANQIALSIVKWVFPLSTFNEETGGIEVNISKVNTILKILYETIKLIVAIAIAKKVASLVIAMQNWALQAKLMSMEARTLGLSVNSLKTSLQALSGVFAVVLLLGIMKVIEKWNEMNTAMKVISVVLLTVVAALYLYSSGMGVAILQTVKFTVIAIANAAKALGTTLINAIKTAITWLGSLSAATITLTIGVGALVAGFTVLALNWDNMGSWQKVITIFAAVAAAAIAAAVAIGVFHTTWTLGVGAAAIAAGVVLVTGSILAAQSATKFADGGYPDKGTYFYAGEAGPEIVANVGGGQTGVMNLAQFEEACYRGTLRAISTSGLDNITIGKGNTILNVNGRELARATINDFKAEASRQNIKFN